MKILIAAAVVIILILVIVLLRSNFSAVPPSPNNPALTDPAWSAQTRSEGEIVVTVEPFDLSSQAKIWSFKITLDTHTVELNEDLMQNTSLEVTGEGLQPPLSWIGDPPGGHHRQGVLNFKPPKISNGEEFTLILQNIGDIAERKFTWKEVKK